VLLLLHLLIDHLLLLVLAQAIELVMLHGLFLLYRHRHLFIWIGKEIVLLDVGLSDVWAWTVQDLALVCLHLRGHLALRLALVSAIDSIMLQAVEILLRNRLRIFHEGLALR